MPQVGLFIPCYIDQLYPQVGLATVEVLEHFGCTLEFPAAQTCCGQPMANTGCVQEAKPLAEHFLNLFLPYEYVVAPSGSCVAMVKHHYREYFPPDSPRDADYRSLQAKTFELSEFLVDILQVGPIGGDFPFQVGLHQSCHGLRELRLGSSSERIGPAFNKARQLLAGLDGLTFSQLSRPDECCGFGGTFAVNEEAVSCMMGLDRIHDHLQAGTQVLTANDMSCLMHLQGLILRQQFPLRILHLAEILAAALRSTSRPRSLAAARGPAPLTVPPAS